MALNVWLMSVAEILTVLILLPSCARDNTIPTGPAGPENSPIIVRTPVSYTLSIEANKLDYDRSDTLSSVVHNFLLSLSVTNGSTGAGYVTVIDAGGDVVWKDSLTGNLVVVNQRMGALMPIRVSISLRNFTGSVSLAIVFGQPSVDILPLAVGNQWVFLATSYATPVPDTVYYEIMKQIHVDHGGVTQEAWAMQIYHKKPSPNPVLWLRWNGFDGVYDGGGITTTDTMLTNILQLKYPARPGDTWQVPNLTYSPYDSSFQIKDTLTYSLDSIGVLLQTPAGLFSCYEYKYTQKPAEDVLEPWDYYWYYCPSIGMVGGRVRGHFDGALNGELLLLRYHIQ